MVMASVGAVMLLGEVLFAPAPSTVVPRNEIERLVLAREERASRELEMLLARRQAEKDRDSKLIEAGFKRVRPEDPCVNYVYSRQLTKTLVRGASLILCTNRPPFILRTDESAGPWRAPKPGEPSVTVPSVPR